MTFVLVCDTWGSPRLAERNCAVEMGHFGVISRCRNDESVKPLQDFKYLWSNSARKERA